MPAEIFNGYKVSNNNGSKAQRPSVTVRNPQGQLCARVYNETGRVLQKIRNNLLAPERHDLIGQLTQAGVPQVTIEEIVSLKGK